MEIIHKNENACIKSELSKIISKYFSDIPRKANSIIIKIIFAKDNKYLLHKYFFRKNVSPNTEVAL